LSADADGFCRLHAPAVVRSRYLFGDVMEALAQMNATARIAFLAARDGLGIFGEIRGCSRDITTDRRRFLLDLAIRSGGLRTLIGGFWPAAPVSSCGMPVAMIPA